MAKNKKETSGVDMPLEDSLEIPVEVSVEDFVEQPVAVPDLQQTAEQTQDLPKAVMFYKHFVLNLQMPGQDAHVTNYFADGKKVYDPEMIAHLIKHQAPIVAIEQ